MMQDQVATARDQVSADKKKSLNEICKLTDAKVRNAKPKVRRYEISDNGSGLRLIVQPSAHKSFVTVTRLRRKQIKVTHGDIDRVTLHDARELNAAAIKQAKNGIDPRKAKKEATAKRQIAEANTFAAVAMLYLNSEKTKKLRTAYQIKDRLTRLAFPLIGDKPIADLKRSNITAALDHIEHTNGATIADRTLSDISCVLKFHARRADDYVLPLVPGMNRTSKTERARDRVLTDDEIRKLWATGNRYAQFLLLTAARRDEAAAMQWKELDGNDWMLPAARNKVKRDFIRPLSKAAMAILPTRGHDDEFVFGLAPDTPLVAFSRIKKQLDAKCGITGWTFHDLRRTARTLMSRAGINADHAERCLGHVIGGVRGTYDRHEYQNEKAHALEALAHQLALITNPPKGNVRQLKRRA
jgi:integrase